MLASDVKASFDRMAYPTNPDMAASLFAPIIQGMEVFNNEQRQLHIASQRSPERNSGYVAIDEADGPLLLTEPQPQFTYMLASPLAGIVPRERGEHPGSAPCWKRTLSVSAQTIRHTVRAQLPRIVLEGRNRNLARQG